jgi:hypothetical protein
MNYKKLSIIIFIVGIIILTGTVIFVKYYNKKLEIDITQGKKPVTNPLKGWAVWGENTSYKQDVTLAYVSINWSDLEKEKGVYDFETIEENFNFEYWKSKNVRFVIRFVCDYPEDEEGNRSIPQWLYDEINGDGQNYNNNYGIGFAPNYSNKIFIAEHKRAIKALADRYNDDPYIAYIQLGSVGHWGEWHVNYGKGIYMLPKANILDQYVQPYIDYFTNKMLSVRRPTVIAGENHFGLFNDVFGDQDETDIWLGWIADGYTSSQTEEEIPGMPKFWENAVSGGEISSNNPLEYYMGENFEETYQQLLACHTTYLGPKAPYLFEKDSEYQDNLDQMTSSMGYCFTINKVVIENLNKKKDLNVTISWENIGVAPIYQNWPICLSIVGMDGKEYAKETIESNMTKWVSGTYDVSYTMNNTSELSKGDYKLLVSISDPITKEPGIALALDDKESDLVYNIGQFSK